ncbi:Trypsin [Phytophthora infestans]|uniref:Trypsin n=1 Tax=Phytophthora infestans TaxID=4787 RepID=A0A8S9TUZ8_PHYIN|nr:Trypsin [Phytophthora infestans]
MYQELLSAGQINYVTVGSHYVNGSQNGVPADGKQIKIASAQIHPQFNINDTDSLWDVAVLKLERPSNYAPVKLPVAGDDKEEMCAGGVAGKGAWAGDMGDPLAKESTEGDANDVLIGVNSAGDGCKSQGIPRVYSRVSAALSWINPIINGQ